MHSLSIVMPGLGPGIHVFTAQQQARRGWPGRARPWRVKPHIERCHARPWRRRALCPTM